MNTDHPVLDHGYVRLVESWGSDERVIEAARMSTDKGFLGWTFEDGTERDMKLLRYLWEHKHTTPFEMAGMTIEVQAPIFVFREWHRHRTQSYNELSARYVPLPDLFYVPSIECLQAARQDQINKQGSSGAQPFNRVEAENRQAQLRGVYAFCRRQYMDLLAMGVAREVARLVIPVSQYSRMRASANLWNWLRFLRLRQAPNAQWEIRQYADIVAGLIGECFPRTYQLFDEARG